MKNINILIPLDFSEETFKSIGAFKPFLDAMDSNIVTIHLLNIVDNPDAKVDYNDESLKNLSMPVLEHGRDMLKGFHVEVISILGCQTSVVDDIISTAYSINAHLIVMTKTSKNLFDKLIVGSTTKGVLKASPVPVLMIP